MPKSHRSRPPEQQTAIRQLPQVTSTCAPSLGRSTNQSRHQFDDNPPRPARVFLCVTARGEARHRCSVDRGTRPFQNRWFTLLAASVVADRIQLQHKLSQKVVSILLRSLMSGYRRYAGAHKSLQISMCGMGSVSGCVQVPGPCSKTIDPGSIWSVAVPGRKSRLDGRLHFGQTTPSPAAWSRSRVTQMMDGTI